MGAASAARELERALRQVGSRERAVNEKRYLNSDLEHIGVGVWEIRRLVREYVTAHAALSHDDAVAFVESLWSKAVHERRMAAVLLLELRPDLMGPADLALLERLIRDSYTWAYVDSLAGDTVGSIIVRYPEAASQLDGWAEDQDFWIRRSALLAAMEPLKLGATFTQFARHADAMLDETEFFIRKAIGWVLRETGKRRPDEVYEWLLPRARRASGVTWREAIKYLTPVQRGVLEKARVA